MGFLVMKNKLHKGFIQELKALALRHVSLNVALSQNLALDIHVEEKKHIISNIIKPLFSGSTDAYLYVDRVNIELRDKLRTILFKKGKKYHFNLQKNIFDGFEEFWGNDQNERGTVIWENFIGNLKLNSILNYTYDPFVMENLGATLSRSAISMAKKTVAFDQSKIVFALSSNGLEWLTIFLNEASIASFVDLAIGNCQLSESFLKLYGP